MATLPTARVPNLLLNYHFFNDTYNSFVLFLPAGEVIRSRVTIVGRSRDQIIGKTVFDVSLPDIAAQYAERDNALFESESDTQVYEYTVLRPGKEEKQARFIKGRIVEENQVIGLVGVVLDFTDDRRETHELLERIHTLDESFRRLRTLAEAGGAVLLRQDGLILDATDQMLDLVQYDYCSSHRRLRRAD